MTKKVIKPKPNTDLKYSHFVGGSIFTLLTKQAFSV